eukprot:815867-Heterocapsa_arctica.AAC.1
MRAHLTPPSPSLRCSAAPLRPSLGPALSPPHAPPRRFRLAPPIDPCGPVLSLQRYPTGPRPARPQPHRH